MRIHNYIHPGEIVKDAFYRQGLGATEAAKRLGVTRTSASRLFNSRIRISPEMAVRLSVVFNTSIAMWINLQSGYDAWLIEKQIKNIAKQVTPIKTPKRSRSTTTNKAA